MLAVGIDILLIFQESCSCVNQLSSVVPEKFYFHGEVLIRPLVVSVSHQHHKVRSVCLQVSYNLIMRIKMNGDDKLSFA